jgi:hypothetical protein
MTKNGKLEIKQPKPPPRPEKEEIKTYSTKVSHEEYLKRRK